MKLTVRNNSYAGASTTARNLEVKFKFIYRGQIFYRTPRLITVDRSNQKCIGIVILTYRGNSYERKLYAHPPYQQPRAINWRWQIA